MKLFRVIRYGCDHDKDALGVDAVDTNFIVRAPGLQDAARIVDEKLQTLPHKKVQPFSHQIFLLSEEDVGNSQETEIVMGPSYEYAYNRGNYPGWERIKESDPWERIGEA